MKTHAGLALLAAFVLVAPGCGKKEQPPEVKPGATNVPLVGPCPCKKPHETNTVSVIVEFTTDDQGKPVAKTKNKTAYVCEGDTVEWIWDTGSLSGPFFDGENPISPDEEIVSQKSPAKAKGPAIKSKKSGKVKKVKQGTYDYKMQLQIGNVFYNVDPRIEVME